ncbi:MAG TPA: Glu-tRNA(Gln) amidotransferase subunit GatD [Candidatus Thalassarchaeaceae archaeon]|nr:Glu-tRNA(Gln) amidotransferase subunit GatD [Candidatus Thalassarchaeaceae archaeon]
MDMPANGSKVRIIIESRMGKQTHEGMLISPAGEGLITIKLANGYNLSHPLDSIDSIDAIETVIEKSQEMKTNSTKSPDLELPLVTLLHTGGTIASKVDYETGAVMARFEPEEILDAVPELRPIARIEAVLIGNMFSDDIRPRHWNQMIRETEAAFERGATGVVITHGTDTMSISAAAMSFAWSGDGGRPPGPIVFTGAQRSSDRASSDAKENLIAAIYLAGHGAPPSGEGDSAVLVMHETSSDGILSILPGISSRKMHSSRRDAFQSIDIGPLGRIHVEGSACSIEILRNSTSSRPIAKPSEFDESIRIAEMIAGPHLLPEHISALASTEPHAIHIHGTGLGHLPIADPNGDSPENNVVEERFQEYINEGGIVVMSTQAIYGPVHLDVYSKGRDQREMGIIGHGAIGPPEVSLVKLHYLLSKYGNNCDEIDSKWAISLCGEISDIQ